MLPVQVAERFEGLSVALDGVEACAAGATDNAAARTSPAAKKSPRFPGSEDGCSKAEVWGLCANMTDSSRQAHTGHGESATFMIRSCAGRLDRDLSGAGRRPRTR